MDLKCYRCSEWPCVCKDGQTIIHGDCREVLPQLEPVDLVLTDPPYGHGERWRGGTWGAAQMYRDAEVWDAERADDDTIKQVLVSGAHAVIWGGNYFCLPPSRCWLSWEKTSRMDTLADFELAWTSFDRPSKSYVSDRNPDGKRSHPTQKPLKLIRWCLQFAGEFHTVLDPFLGSGTTLRACKDLGRRGIGIEIEERYCEIAANRLRQEVLDFETTRTAARTPDPIRHMT
jgi:site-specific DNA-methyltransferase (adenine-specific)